MYLAQEEDEASAEVTSNVGRNGVESKFKLCFFYPFAGIWKCFHKSFSLFCSAQRGAQPHPPAGTVGSPCPCPALLTVPPALHGRIHGIRAVWALGLLSGEGAEMGAKAAAPARSSFHKVGKWG